MGDETTELGVSAADINISFPLNSVMTQEDDFSKELVQPKLFSEDEIAEFRKKGYLVFQSKGEVLSEELLDKFVRPFMRPDEADFVGKQKTICGYLVVPPKIYLPKSEYKTYDEASNLLHVQSEEIQRQFPNSTLRMGEIVDLILIEDMFQKEHDGKSLFGDEYIRSMTFFDINKSKNLIDEKRTEKEIDADQRNLIFIPSAKIVENWHPDATAEHLRAVGIIVPQ